VKVSEFIADTKLPSDLTLIDTTGLDEFAKALGLNRKPGVLLVRSDRMEQAATVSRGEHVTALLDGLRGQDWGDDKLQSKAAAIGANGRAPVEG
jgi:hypothetical protein